MRGNSIINIEGTIQIKQGNEKGLLSKTFLKDSAKGHPHTPHAPLMGACCARGKWADDQVLHGLGRAAPLNMLHNKTHIGSHVEQDNMMCKQQPTVFQWRSSLRI